MTPRHPRFPRRAADAFSRRSSGEPRSRPGSARAALRPGSRRRAGPTSRSSPSSPARPANAGCIGRGRLHPERVRRGAGQAHQAHLAATAPLAWRRSATAEAIVSTSGSRERGHGRRGRRRPGRDRDRCSRPRSASPVDGRCTSRRASSGRACRSTAWPTGSAALVAAPRGQRRRRSRPRRSRSARRIRGPRSRRRRSTCPDRPARTAGHVTVSGIAKGVGMIHPRMATMLVDRPDRRDRRARRPLGPPPAGRRADLEPALGRRRHEHERHGLRPGLRGGGGRAGRRRAADGRARSARAIEAVARDLARQQAADGEGATTLITAGVGRPRRRRRAGRRPGGRLVVSLVKAAAHGRDPNWGRIAGAAGNARLADAAVLEAAGLAADEAAARGGTAGRRSIPIGCGSRSPAISSSTARTAGPSRSIAPRRGPRWTPPSSSSASTWASATGRARRSAAT